MMCLELKPGAAGWMEQTNPLSYSGTPKKLAFLFLNKGRFYFTIFSKETFCLLTTTTTSFRFWKQNCKRKEAVWPDSEKFCHFGKMFQVLGKFMRVNLVFGKIFGKNVMLLGKFS